MNYPYENYIKLLFIKGYSDPTIAERVRSLKLIPPNARELEEKRDNFIESLPASSKQYLDPANYQINTFLNDVKKHKVTLGVESLSDVLTGKRNLKWEDALLLMVDLDARIIVQTLSIFGYSDGEILDNLKKRIGMEIDHEALELFYHYFWNVKSLSKLELYHYIATCSIAKHRELLTDAYHKKAARIKWHITGTNILTLEGILDDVVNTAYEKYRSCADGEDTAANDSRAISWANMAMNAAEKLKEAASAADANTVAAVKFDLEQLRQEDIFKQEDLGDIV